MKKKVRMLCSMLQGKPIFEFDKEAWHIGLLAAFLSRILGQQEFRSLGYLMKPWALCLSLVLKWLWHSLSIVLYWKEVQGNCHWRMQRRSLAQMWSRNRPATSPKINKSTYHEYDCSRPNFLYDFFYYFSLFFDLALKFELQQHNVYIHLLQSCF